jgi:hypothetical protein
VFLAQSIAILSKNVIVTLIFEEICQLFRRKLAKIAQNCAHNIDPWIQTIANNTGLNGFH